jgi:hypothetical protein
VNWRLYVAPPLLSPDDASENVTLCASAPEFHVQVTVVPAGTTMLGALKKSLPIETWLLATGWPPPPGLVESPPHADAAAIATAARKTLPLRISLSDE